MAFIYIKKMDHFPKNLDGINYQTKHSSGIDLVAAISDSIIIKPFERILVPTGVSIAFNEFDLEAQIRSRSGLAFKNGIIVLNSPGTIDNDYRGEIKVLLINLSNEEFKIEPGMRIAQMVIAKYIKVEQKYIDDLSFVSTERNDGGFGSTGK
jgi:dUTP pyrophosphatase